MCAALTGILLASLLGSGTASAADSYLLNAFAAVFLGSATLRDGEFHILGTLIGVLIIAIGFNGLSIFGADRSGPVRVQGRHPHPRRRPVHRRAPILAGLTCCATPLSTRASSRRWPAPGTARGCCSVTATTRWPRRPTPRAAVVHLNLRPGTVAGRAGPRDTASPRSTIEAAAVMSPGDGPEPDIFPDLPARICRVVELDRARPVRRSMRPHASHDICLVIATGEQRLFANILLTLGVVQGDLP